MTKYAEELDKIIDTAYRMLKAPRTDSAQVLQVILEAVKAKHADSAQTFRFLPETVGHISENIENYDLKQGKAENYDPR